MGAVVENWSVNRTEKTHGVFYELAHERYGNRGTPHPEQPKMGSNGRSSCALPLRCPSVGPRLRKYRRNKGGAVGTVKDFGFDFRLVLG
jgi:hypothetical protein